MPACLCVATWTMQFKEKKLLCDEQEHYEYSFTRCYEPAYTRPRAEIRLPELPVRRAYYTMSDLHWFLTHSFASTLAPSLLLVQSISDNLGSRFPLLLRDFHSRCLPGSRISLAHSCTSFYPTKEARYAYLAIRAFNVELSSIASSVSNPSLGRVRFQWWREALSSLSPSSSSPTTPHPTVLALSSAVRRHKLSTYHLTRLIDAKERNFLDPSYSSLSSLVSYAQSTNLPLLSLQLQVLLTPLGAASASRRSAAEVDGIPLSTIDHALSHLATYITLSQLLRGLHYFAAHKRTITLPRDVASAHGVVDEAVFRALPALSSTTAQEVSSSSSSPAASQDVVQAALSPVLDACGELTTLAALEASKARWTLGLEKAQDEEHAALSGGRRLSRLPKAIAPVFLSAIPTNSFLGQFEKEAKGNPFHPLCAQRDSRNWRLPVQMLWASWRRRF